LNAGGLFIDDTRAISRSRSIQLCRITALTQTRQKSIKLRAHRLFACTYFFSLTGAETAYNIDTVTPCGINRSAPAFLFARTRLHCACSARTALLLSVHQVLLIIDGIARLRPCIHDDISFSLAWKEPSKKSQEISNMSL